MKRRWAAMGAGSAISVAACVWASSFIADAFGHQPALGAPAISIGGARLYPPWRVFEWSARWSATFPRPFAAAQLIALGGFVFACIIAALVMRRDDVMKPFAEGAWGGFDDAAASGLFARAGAILGKLDGEVLCFDGPEHQLLIGASRSGKGRGHVVPTLLTWPHSALVLDIKGELADGDERHGFPGTAGFRETIGPVLRFAPTRADSVSFNPLFEVRRGANEVRDVQNIVEILVDPAGDGRHQDFWDRSAKHVLVGLILHVLYVEPIERKTLAIVREKLRDLDATALEMKSVYHRISPTTGAPEIHPEVLHAAESFLAGEERMQSGIKATAESFFGLFADEIVAKKTATSDFRIGDLMCLERPVTLYLQPPPSDALRLTPLMRLIINQFARALMEDQTRDAQGRVKRHRMLLLLDGTYDNAVAYGDRRLVLVWNRLILPNGWSINLQNMQGGDPTGAAGLRDRTDNHFDRLAGAIALSAIISVVANNAEDDDDGASLSQSVGDAAAQEAARTGGRIVERELSVRPTLRVRAGAPVRVLVMRDIALRPYRENRNDGR